jgi:hypothetical protein
VTINLNGLTFADRADQHSCPTLLYRPAPAYERPPVLIPMPEVGPGSWLDTVDLLFGPAMVEFLTDQEESVLA